MHTHAHSPLQAAQAVDSEPVSLLCTLPDIIILVEVVCSDL